jgi:hypothetical protein
VIDRTDCGRKPRSPIPKEYLMRSLRLFKCFSPPTDFFEIVLRSSEMRLSCQEHEANLLELYLKFFEV